MKEEKEKTEDNNPFYSLVDKGQIPFMSGKSKSNIAGILIIILVLTIGIIGVYFFNEGNKEKRIENIGEWYIGLGEMLCEDNKECVKYIDTKFKDAFIENSFIPQEKIEIDELKDQFTQELKSITGISFKEKDIHLWIDKCQKHPDIQTGTAIRYCTLSMMLLDQHLDSQF